MAEKTVTAGNDTSIHLGEKSSAVQAQPTLWYVYLLRCADGSLYCGITTHVERRLAQHNGDLAGGAKCTRARRPVVLEGSICCADRATASRYEHQIKKMPREQKLSALLALTS